jgi:hypothetical protein
MAVKRPISTSFWKDSYIDELAPVEKLLFLYLLSNPNTSIAGIYEIRMKEIIFDTGISKEHVEEILKKFQKDNKIFYEKNWLVMQNWVKHQAVNPSVKAGISRVLDELPKWLRVKLGFEQEDAKLPLFDGQPEHSLSTEPPQSGTLNLTLLNLTKLNLTEHADKPPVDKVGVGKSRKATGEQYRRAVKADDEQRNRARRSFTRKPATPTTTQEDAEKIYRMREGR